MKPIRTLIADDEPLGRRRIQTLLAGEDDIEVVGLCANGAEAVEAIRTHEPDLVFLDVQMPVLDGFDVLEAIGPTQMPAVIFVTAYDQYALRAFDVHALDYLLKPFDRTRFEEALRQARAYLQRSTLAALQARLADLLAERKQASEPAPSHTTRLAVKQSGRVYFVAASDVDWIEAAGNYVSLHVGNRTHLIRGTMQEMTEQLDPEQFVRVHRSALVNVERITAIEPSRSGGYVLTLESGAEVPASRKYRSTIRHLIDASPAARSLSKT